MNLRRISAFFFISFSLLAQASEHLHDRMKGSLFGGALGDAMGKPTEFIKTKEQIVKRYPHGIQSFADFKQDDFVNGIPVVTDDTVMSNLTLSELIQAREKKWDLNRTMSAIACAYVKDMDNPHGWAASYRAPGNTCLANVRKLKALLKTGQPWKKNPRWWDIGTQEQGGCGSVMHAHPFGLVFADDPEKAAAWAAEHSKITHGAPMAIAACAAMALGTALGIQGKDPQLTMQKMIESAKQYDVDTAHMMEEAKAHAKTNFDKSAQLYLEDMGCTLSAAYLNMARNSEPIYEKYLGWDARTAIAATVYTFGLASHSPKFAIYLGVHTPGDSDSIASMSGALAGAHAGFERLSENWQYEVARVEGSKQLEQLADQTSALLKK